MLTLLRHLDRLHVSEAEIEGIPVHIASFTNITVQFPTMEYVIRIHVTVRLIRLWVLVSMSEQYNASSTSRKFSTSNTCRVFNSILARYGPLLFFNDIIDVIDYGMRKGV